MSIPESKHDVCATCKHPRHRHKGNAGMCTEADTLKIATAPDGSTTGITIKGQPCHCNLFQRYKPYKPGTGHPLAVLLEDLYHIVDPKGGDLSVSLCGVVPETDVRGDYAATPYGYRSNAFPARAFCPACVTACELLPATADESTVETTAQQMRAELPTEFPVTDSRWPHLPRGFLDAMNAVFEAGIKDDREPGDWKDLEPQYALSKEGNLLTHMGEHEYDAVGCNAAILWWHFQRDATADTIDPGDDEGTTE